MARGIYMDVHVAAAITDGLERRGVDVLTAQTDGTREVDDESLLQRTTELRRLLFTRDEDFLKIGGEWQQEDREFAGIAFAHQLGPGIGQIIEDLELIATCAHDDEVFNRVIHLPLS